MRIAKVIGKVTLNDQVESFVGGSLRVVRPLTREEIETGAEPKADAIVVWDDFGAGLGDLIAMSEGGEAAQPFLPERKPVDAYNAAIIDAMDI